LSAEGNIILINPSEAVFKQKRPAKKEDEYENICILLRVAHIGNGYAKHE
jgi:hypothetical protein